MEQISAKGGKELEVKCPSESVGVLLGADTEMALNVQEVYWRGMCIRENRGEPGGGWESCQTVRQAGFTCVKEGGRDESLRHWCSSKVSAGPTGSPDKYNQGLLANMRSERIS